MRPTIVQLSERHSCRSYKFQQRLSEPLGSQWMFFGQRTSYIPITVPRERAKFTVRLRGSMFRSPGWP